MLVQCTFRPDPWSMYSRCPQVGEPFLHPPPTPKFALLPRKMMKPPPVRKSQGTSQANAGAGFITDTRTPSADRNLVAVLACRLIVGLLRSTSCRQLMDPRRG